MNKNRLILLLYALAHAVVDFISVGVIFTVFNRDLLSYQNFFILLLIYNILAFGLQPLVGYLVDYFGKPVYASIFSFVLLFFSLISYFYYPSLVFVLAGLGNAMFHVAGGSIILTMYPGKTTYPAIFVAPGAIGLFLGIWLGYYGRLEIFPLLLLSLIFILTLFFSKNLIKDYKPSKINLDKKVLLLILILLLFSIGVRSLLGFVISFPWKANLILASFLTVSIFFGKALGGFLADKIGWIKTGVGALLISIPFLYFGKEIVWLGFLGAFIFQMTTPVTLVAVFKLFPEKPAFAFGLPCLALIIGALPAFFPFKIFFQDDMIRLSMVVLSATALFFAIKFLIKNKLYDEKI